MKLYKFISEEIILSDIIDIIKKDCKYYLNNVNEKYHLFRGIWASDIGSKFKKLKTLENRRPRNTKKEVTELLDESFKSKFNIKARTSTLFCTGSLNDTFMYGDPFFIFPIGKYDFIWSDKIHDLFIDLSHIRTLDSTDEKLFKLYNASFSPSVILKLEKLDIHFYSNIELLKKSFNINIDNHSSIEFITEQIRNVNKKIILDITNKFISKNYHKNDNLINALKSGNEIMLSCKEYYVVNASEYPKIFSKIFE